MRPARCSQVPPRPSSRSSAPIASVALQAQVIGRPRLRRAGGRHVCWRSRCSSCRPRRRSGCAEPGRVRAQPSRRWPCGPGASWSGPATSTPWRATATVCSWLAYLLAGIACGDRDRPVPGGLVLVACGLFEVLRRTRLQRGGGCQLEPRRSVHGGGVVRWDRRPRLDGIQGRSALLRGRLRDHPPDAGGCRRRLPLDDRRPVPERRRAVAGDARAGSRNRDGGRLRRHMVVGGVATVLACGGRLRPVVLLHPARRWAVRAAARERPCGGGSSTERARQRSVAILGSAVTLAGALSGAGRSVCWRALRSPCWS